MMWDGEQGPGIKEWAQEGEGKNREEAQFKGFCGLDKGIWSSLKV